jgi:hypothetical protein
MNDRRRYESRSSGPRWNGIVESMVTRFWERVAFFEEILTEGSYPPFTEPLSPQQQYERLVAWRNAGDQRYWASEEAQQALDLLGLQFGTPPPLAPTPMQIPRNI